MEQARNFTLNKILYVAFKIINGIFLWVEPANTICFNIISVKILDAPAHEVAGRMALGFVQEGAKKSPSFQHVMAI